MSGFLTPVPYQGLPSVRTGRSGYQGVSPNWHLLTFGVVLSAIAIWLKDLGDMP